MPTPHRTYCKHGVDLRQVTKDGWPRCPLCRHQVQHSTPTYSKPTPVLRFDPEALAAPTQPTLID